MLRTSVHSLIWVLNPMDRGDQSPQEDRIWALLALMTLICASARVFLGTPPGTRSTQQLWWLELFHPEM